MTHRNLRRHALLCALGVGALTGCGNFSGDGEEYFELDRLRVLGVRSTPADIITGETATLSALVFEPKDRAVEYEWSWCLSRADESGGFECTIKEAALKKAWAQTGSPLELPPYALGSEPEAQFLDVFTPEALPILCDALTKKSPDREQARLVCLYSFEVSVQLTVRSGGKEVTAIKSLVLLPADTDPAQRNTAPEFDAKIDVRDVGVTPPKSGVKTLQAEHRYAVTASVIDNSTESFAPPPSIDNPSPKAHLETLVMSWFITDGDFFDPAEDVRGGGGFGGGSLTTFVDGRNELEDVLKNGWELPRTAGPEDARLFLVLRDERGGVAWSEHRFPVKENR